MYLRFIIDEKDEDSGRHSGIFHAAGNLRDSGTLDPYDETRLQEIRDWFDLHLDKPTRFSTSKAYYPGKTMSRGISWFKDTAHDHIANIREMADILEDHGIPVTVLKAERVGYVVYEDEYQIVAEPFADTRA